MELIENEESEILADGIPDAALVVPSHQQLEHHVIGQQDVRRGTLDLVPKFSLGLTGVCLVVDRKGLTGALLVILSELVQLLDLGIDQGVHRIDENSLDAFASAIGKEIVEDTAEIGQRLSRARARGHDEAFWLSPQLQRMDLVGVEFKPLEDMVQLAVKGAVLDQISDSDVPLVGRIELNQGFGPESSLRQLRFDRFSDVVIVDVDEAVDVGSVAVDDFTMNLEDVHGRGEFRSGRSGVFPFRLRWLGLIHELLDQPQRRPPGIPDPVFPRLDRLGGHPELFGKPPAWLADSLPPGLDVGPGELRSGHPRK